MKVLPMLVLAALIGACASTQERGSGVDSVSKGALSGDLPLVMKVSAWAVYADGGENYIHLWSPGAPKSVFVVRENDVPKDFLATLRREIPMAKAVVISATGLRGLAEAPTYLTKAEITGLVQVGNDGHYGDAPPK